MSDVLFPTALQHHKAGRLAQAEALYRQILAQNPDHADALHMLGLIALQTGRGDVAVDLIRRAIALRPNFPEAHNNLAIALKKNGQLDAAIAAYRQAVALKPNDRDVRYNFGNALKDAGQLDAAIAEYHVAISLKPNLYEPYNNVGNALKDTGQLDAAIAAFRKAVELEPRSSEVHSNLIYSLNFHPDYDGPRILAEHRQWADKFALPLARRAPGHHNDLAPGRRLRIGYVSPDFQLHPVGRFLLPLFAHHNHRDFEIIAYSSVQRPDDVTKRLRESVDSWQDIRALGDAQAADKIRADGVDILIDLSLHMAENRMLLFARKPATVQATYLGHIGTTGLATMDYRFSDPYLDPLGQSETFYVEKTLCLPDSFFCYDPPDAAPNVNDLPAAADGHITFGCFNNFCKVTTPALELWADILHELPGSELVIHAKAASSQENVRHLFAAAGVDAGRIRFVGFQPLKDYFANYSRIDIVLDPFPYGGGITTCDALWMGVPVVTLAGRTAVGRTGVSLLSNLGLNQWIAQTPGEYVDIARHWAADLPCLAELRRELRPRMQKSVLMDGPRFAAGMEAALRQMWIEWCKNKSPAS